MLIAMRFSYLWQSMMQICVRVLGAKPLNVDLKAGLTLYQCTYLAQEERPVNSERLPFYAELQLSALVHTYIVTINTTQHAPGRRGRLAWLRLI